jgi:hypothetical protein
MITPDFPRVTIPGVEVTPEGRAIVEEATALDAVWRRMRLKAAFSLMRNGQEPYVRPPAAEVAKRRAKGKRQRAARKVHR